MKTKTEIHFGFDFRFCVHLFLFSFSFLFFRFCFYFCFYFHFHFCIFFFVFIFFFSFAFVFVVILLFILLLVFSLVFIFEFYYGTSKPPKKTYRHYKKFHYLKFNNELKTALTKENIDNCQFDKKLWKFQITTLEAIECKSRVICVYIFMSWRLKIKNYTENSLRAFKKQKNFCMWLLEKRKPFFKNLYSLVVKDNGLFFFREGDHGSNIQLFVSTFFISNHFLSN